LFNTNTSQYSYNTTSDPTTANGSLNPPLP
jgi:hypothetical protein